MTVPGAPGPVGVSTAPSTVAACPYLLAADGAWRSSTATREHRCTAVAPPAVLALDKQRRLCLVEEHLDCTTYAAAIGTVDGSAGHRGRVRATSRPIVRTIPLILDHGRIDVVLSRLSIEHRVGQGGLVALLAVAFGALIITRLSSGGVDLTPSSVQVVGSPSPSATVTVVPFQTPTAPAPTAPAPTAPAPSAPAPSAPAPTAPAPTLVPSDVSPSPDPTVPPAAPSAEPSTYTVKQGDTLSAIAGRLGTTWQVLAELNGIDDPSRLRVGQTLDLP